MDGAFILFDVSDRQSFDNIKDWHHKINEYCDSPIKILVGNKLDKNYENSITNETCKYLKLDL